MTETMTAPRTLTLTIPGTPAYAKFRQRDDYASLWTFGVKGTF